MTRLGAALWLLAATLPSCSTGRGVLTGGRYRGEVVAPPVPVPDFTLTATDGRPYEFGPQARGTVTLLYFGYTNCPDVCPVHMAALSAALRQLPPEVARRVRVVFVTVDPARDTLPRLREWLDSFDPDFVGLRGPMDSVNAVQQRLHLPTTAVAPRPDSGYGVGHGAAVLAVVGDSVRVLYPFGTRERDWVYDLPKLVAAIPRAAEGS